MESDRCPTATFILTAPLALRSGVADCERVTASATGDLTIHGVINRVTIELEAELKGDSAVVVASAPGRPRRSVSCRSSTPTNMRTILAEARYSVTHFVRSHRFRMGISPY